MTPEGVTVGLRQSSGAFRALCLLLLAAFLLGGGARGDLQSLMILRPLAAGFLFYGLAKLERHHWAANKPVLGLAFAIIALQVLHLVPLPPAMWSLLPGRDLIVGIDRAAGLGNVWRPLSLAPDATLNGLYASLIPCAALILGLQLAPHERRLLLWPVLLLGGLSALAAIVQLSGGPHGPLYFYRVTNPGAAVGLFANRNHQALLLACLLPALTVWVAGERPQGRTVQFELAGFRKFAAVLAAAAIILLVLVTGSRAGLVLACFAIVSLPVVWPDAFGEMSRNANGKRRLGNKQLLLAAIAVAFIAGMIAIALWRGKGLAIERLFGASSADDMRVLILPELTRLIQFYLPLGSGLGSFERVFQVHEPDGLLRPTYANHVHNDWLEIAMTGGVPALALLVGAAIIFALRARTLLFRQIVDSLELRTAKLGMVIIILSAIASLVDYPLRVPSFACLFVVAIIWMSCPLPKNPPSPRPL